MVVKNEMEAIKALSEKVAGIIESGSNDNGDYIKFSDGTMIQYGQVDTNLKDFTAQYGSVFYNQSFSTINFPLEFIAVPIVMVNQELGGYLGGNSLGGLPTKTNFRVYLYITKSGVINRNAIIYWQAIGRWK